MKTEFKYIRFELIDKKPKTSVYGCYSVRSNDLLAKIAWYGSWRQYCFYPACETIFNVGCMNDIIEFIQELSKK